MTPKGTRFQHRGLGDTIAAVTKITRIDKVAKFVANAIGEEDCGCTERQENLNTRFPYKKRK
jgi:hypothetical protein